MSLNQSLKDIGLNDKEVKVYVTLLKSGRLRPSALSKLTGINRATIYHTAKDLVNRGLIAEDLGGATIYLTALPPENLKQIIERPKRELESKTEKINDLIEEIKQLNTKENYFIPKIRFIEEDKIKDFLFENGLKWVKELHKNDGIWWSFQDPSFVEHYESFVEWISKTKEYKDPKICSRLITNQAPIEEKVSKKVPATKRQLRFIPGLDFSSSIWISGDYVVMITTNKHPFYLIEIHDTPIAHNLREMFKKMWELTN